MANNEKEDNKESDALLDKVRTELLLNFANIAKLQVLLESDIKGDNNGILDKEEVQRASPIITQIDKDLLEKIPSLKVPMQEEVNKIREMLSGNPKATHVNEKKWILNFLAKGLKLI